MDEMIKHPTGFFQVSILMIGIFNVYFIGSEYQDDKILDLIYFSVVMLAFLVSLLWTLSIIIYGKNPKSLAKVELGYNALASIFTFGGVVCYVVSFARENSSDELQGRKVITCILGFLSVVFYAFGSFSIYLYSEDKDGENKPSKPKLESVAFIEISTLVIGICNVFFIGAEYQVRETLDLIYFIVVIVSFITTLLWTLANVLWGKRLKLQVEAGLYLVTSLLYFGGLICFIVEYAKENGTIGYRGGIIISSILGFISCILYASGTILLFLDKSQHSRPTHESGA